MINLLPPDIKSSYDYAGRNVHAVKWVIALAIVFVGLLGLGTTGYIYMQHLSSDYQKQITTKQQSLEDQKLEETQKAAKDISNSLKLAVTVLSKEVLFSKLLSRLGAVTPANVRLSSLNISETTGAIDIIASSANYQSATQLQVNLADPDNKIFSKADIISVNCSSNPSNTGYPCTVTVRALFADDNPFLFINSGAR